MSKELFSVHLVDTVDTNDTNLYNRVMARVEEPLVHCALLATHGNQFRAARVLGISRGNLRMKMHKYNLLGLSRWDMLDKIRQDHLVVIGSKCVKPGE